MDPPVADVYAGGRGESINTQTFSLLSLSYSLSLSLSLQLFLYSTAFDGVSLVHRECTEYVIRF